MTGGGTRPGGRLAVTLALDPALACLEPLRQGVRQVFGRFAKDVARDLWIRCDWGPQYIADAWIHEVSGWG